MNSNFKYQINMANLWRDPKYKTYYVQWQENGKTRRKALCLPGQGKATKDKRLAKRLLNNFQRDLIAGKIKPISDGIKIDFYKFINEFLSHIETRTEDSTYTLYTVALNKAKDSWGDIPLNHITARHLDTFIADLTKAGLKTATVNKNYRHVKAALKQAIKWEYMKPILFPKPLKEKKEARFLTLDDLKTLMGSIDDKEFYDFCLFSVYTGLRSGEIIRLTFNDTDNPKGFIRISSEQKNREESRIPINTHSRAIIDACRIRQKNKTHLFRFKTLTWVSQKFKKYATKADLNNYRFHDLRHTYASHMAMSGEDLKAIQELMRHKSISSTMVYAHLSPEHLTKVSNRVNYGPLPAPAVKNKNGK